VYPVQEGYEMNPSPEYIGSWVAEVTVAKALGRQIRYFKSKASLYERERIVRATIKKFSPGAIMG
jgi:hypothetical protein